MRLLRGAPPLRLFVRRAPQLRLLLLLRQPGGLGINESVVMIDAIEDQANDGGVLRPVRKAMLPSALSAKVNANLKREISGQKEELDVMRPFVLRHRGNVGFKGWVLGTFQSQLGKRVQSPACHFVASNAKQMPSDVNQELGLAPPLNRETPRRASLG